MQRQRFQVFSWASLGFLFFVIVWGAFVRATGSGAGCGDHWPTCNGVLIPRAPSVQTVIEFTHRATSGLSGILILIQTVWAFRLFPKKHAVRGSVLAALVFLVLEAAIGAGIVLFEWVAHNVSVARALSMGVHLINTFLLLFSQTAVCFHAQTDGKASSGFFQRRHAGWVVAGLLGILLTGVTGTIAALGDTLLFVSVPQGQVEASNLLLNTLLQLRISHPIVALVAAGFIWLAASKAEDSKRLSVALSLMVVLQLLLGMLNVALQAPVWLQLTHLLLADTMWVSMVWLGFRQPEVQSDAVEQPHRNASQALSP